MDERKRSLLFRFVAVVTFLALADLPAVHAQGFSTPRARDSNVGYIDPAPPADQFRLRYDSSFDNPRPSRAEFFWPKSGPFSPGPPRPETSVDAQELTASVEALLADRLSGFVEGQLRYVNPAVNESAVGFGDMNAGFKYALLCREDLVATLQLRTYLPTGDGKRGLGVEHVSLEPAVLVYSRLSDKVCLEGELRDWVPIGGTDFAGNVLRYGAGVSYDLVQTERVGILPVAELVGWTVLGGKESMPVAEQEFRVKQAAGDTIVNLKIGARFQITGWGSLYTGYGRALTGDRWYANTFRVEWRLRF
jgi:hypothetical protein